MTETIPNTSALYPLMRINEMGSEENNDNNLSQKVNFNTDKLA